jgi:Protein of unknown function (DUF3738)
VLNTGRLLRPLLLNVSGPTWANERTAIGCNGGGNGLCFTAGPDANTPSLFTALQAQAGLQLVLTTAPVEVVVIDHVEMPGKTVAPASTQDLVGNWQGILQGPDHPMQMGHAGDTPPAC